METQYRIIYSGRLLPGRNHHAVVEQLAHKFHMSLDEARELVMNGGGRVIKHDLSITKAERYLEALASVGLEIELEAQLEPSVASDEPAASDSRASPQIKADAPRVDAPHAVAAGRGWGWIQDAWALFKQTPWAWIGALLLFYLIMVLIGLVPLIGGLATTILGPILTAGLLLGAQAQDRGEGFGVGRLFAGFSVRPGALALVGLVYLGSVILVVLVIGLLGFFMLGGAEMLVPTLSPEGLRMMSEQNDAMALGVGLVPILVGLLLVIPLTMAMYFAPALVALDAVPVMRAFKLSLIGCLKNILPFLVFGLLAFVLIFLGTIPLFLGWLVIVPVLTIAVYTAYRDIFR